MFLRDSTLPKVLSPPHKELYYVLNFVVSGRASSFWPSLDLILRNKHLPTMVTHIFNHSTGKREKGGVQGQFGLHDEFQAS